MKLPEIKFEMPSPEKLRASALNWLEAQKGTSLDELPAEVMKLSMKTEFFEIDVPAFLTAFDQEDMSEPTRLAQAASAWNWKSAVYKLCTRSPKDAWGMHGVCSSSVQGIHWMTYSERILDDMCRFSHLPERPPTLAVREAVHPLGGFGKSEIRCFVKDGDLIGMTDYDYHSPDAFSGGETARLIFEAVSKFFAEKLSPVMHLKTYVFDILFRHDREIVLIEINPYGLSDPCFYTGYAEIESGQRPFAHKGNAASTPTAPPNPQPASDSTS